MVKKVDHLLFKGIVDSEEVAEATDDIELGDPAKVELDLNEAKELFRRALLATAADNSILLLNLFGCWVAEKVNSADTFATSDLLLVPIVPYNEGR